MQAGTAQADADPTALRVLYDAAGHRSAGDVDRGLIELSAEVLAAGHADDLLAGRDRVVYPRILAVLRHCEELSDDDAKRRAGTIAISAALRGQELLDERLEQHRPVIAPVKPAENEKRASRPRFDASALLKTLDTVEPAMPTYRVWKPYVPEALTILAGDYGDGKSWIALAMAAHGSRGWPLPDETGKPTGSCEPFRTLYLSIENDPSTLRFRIDRLGGDPRNITIWNTDVAPLPTLSNLGALDGALATVRPALLVIDPLQSVVGGKLDLHRCNEVRAVLDPLAVLCRKHGCSPLCIMHLNKAQTLGAKYRMNGSIDFGAAARSILVVARDPFDPKRRVMAHLKASDSQVGVSQTFIIDKADKDVEFAWMGSCSLTADEILAANVKRSDQTDTKTDQALEFLRGALREGPVAKRILEDRGEAQGISLDALKRAAGKLRVRFVSGGFPRCTKWTLP